MTLKREEAGRNSGPDDWESSLCLLGDLNTDLDWRCMLYRSIRSRGFGGRVVEGNRLPSLSYPWHVVIPAIADCVVYWYPHGIETELPTYQPSTAYELVVGTPPTAPLAEELRQWCVSTGVPFASSIEETAELATMLLGHGSIRVGPERDITLAVWRTKELQIWRSNQREAGNRIEAARTLWAFRGNLANDPIWYWAIHTDIFVTEENRYKTNEVVLGRPDISATVMYHRSTAEQPSTQVVLVREFRTPVSNSAGYVLELPSGSGAYSADPAVVASDECAEETGLRLPVERFRYHGVRQIASTMSCHRGHLFSVALGAGEIDALRGRRERPQGSSTNERTWVEVVDLDRALSDGSLDWGMLGMLWAAIREAP